VKRISDMTSMNVFIKGIGTGEDAAIAVQHGADGLFVSNHGGRAENGLRSAIECLPEVLAAVKRKVPVEVDGGIRRGTDTFKALALGATRSASGGRSSGALARSGLRRGDDAGAPAPGTGDRHAPGGDPVAAEAPTSDAAPAPSKARSLAAS